MVSIALYTNEPVLAAGFRVVAASEPDIVVVGICNTLEQAINLAETQNAEVLLVDLTTAVTLSRLAEARRRLPKCKLVLWVSPISVELAIQFRQIGVRGIIRKDMAIDTMFRSLEKVGNGELWFDRELLTSMLEARSVHLSRRERQLLELVSQGLSNKQIAAVLSISEGTVKVYFSKLFRKVGVSDRLELALYGLRSMPAVETTGGPVLAIRAAAAS
jgi:DNA-binding NarL/FixJ family response regulator